MKRKQMKSRKTKNHSVCKTHESLKINLYFIGFAALETDNKFKKSK